MIMDKEQFIKEALEDLNLTEEDLVIHEGTQEIVAEEVVPELPENLEELEVPKEFIEEFNSENIDAIDKAFDNKSFLIERQLAEIRDLARLHEKRALEKWDDKRFFKEVRKVERKHKSAWHQVKMLDKRENSL
jgi:hypothetical protein